MTPSPPALQSSVLSLLRYKPAPSTKLSGANTPLAIAIAIFLGETRGDVALTKRAKTIRQARATRLVHHNEIEAPNIKKMLFSEPVVSAYLSNSFV